MSARLLFALLLKRRLRPFVLWNASPLLVPLVHLKNNTKDLTLSLSLVTLRTVSPRGLRLGPFLGECHSMIFFPIFTHVPFHSVRPAEASQKPPSWA